MVEVHSGSLDFSTPLVFADGSNVFERFTEEHVSHKKGYFIMAPSGAGKTYFLNHQKEKHWMDGDTLWEVAGACPKGAWWTWDVSLIEIIDARSDIITQQAKMLGLWVMGASNNWLKPDAIVLPHWSTHKKYIRERELDHYDGGAKSDRLPQVLGHRKWIAQWKKKGVPCFKSVQEATDYLEADYQKYLDSLR